MRRTPSLSAKTVPAGTLYVSYCCAVTCGTFVSGAYLGERPQPHTHRAAVALTAEFDVTLWRGFPRRNCQGVGVVSDPHTETTKRSECVWPRRRSELL
jgi:hypothetical protein